MILGFLQNAYTTDEVNAHRLETMFADVLKAEQMQARRKQGLFEWNNYTGKLIKKYFGAELCNYIWWENASPRWGWESHHTFPPDHNHIKELLTRLQPTIVLTFGKMASNALKQISVEPEYNDRFILLPGPHPAARRSEKYIELQTMHNQLLLHIDEVGEEYKKSYAMQAD